MDSYCITDKLSLISKNIMRNRQFVNKNLTFFILLCIMSLWVQFAHIQIQKYRHAKMKF